jgi:hypothetical protein
LFTDDPLLAERFAEGEDTRPNRGIYTCLNPLVPGAERRCLETVAALQFIYFDLDIQNIDATREQVLDRLRQLPVEFVWVRDSGSGNLHVGIEIKDPPLRDTPEYDRVVAVWKRLAVKFAADPAPVHPAALIRKVGTRNKKNGGNGVCHILWNGGGPIDVTELEELDELLAEPLWPRKQAAGGNELPAERNRSTEQSGPEYSEPENKPPVDVDNRLAQMRWQGPGDTSIHMTQLSVTAAMLRQGISLEETVRTVLDATRAAVANDRTWDWDQEEHTVRRMCADLINKDPGELADRLSDDMQQKVMAALAEGRRPKILYGNGGWHVRTFGDRADSKTNIVRNLLLKGTTVAEILEATGWPSVSVPHMARTAGLTLESTPRMA